MKIMIYKLASGTNKDTKKDWCRISCLVPKKYNNNLGYDALDLYLNDFQNVGTSAFEVYEKIKSFDDVEFPVSVDCEFGFNNSIKDIKLI